PLPPSSTLPSRLRSPLSPPLFPYTTLFRSRSGSTCNAKISESVAGHRSGSPAGPKAAKPVTVRLPSISSVATTRRWRDVGGDSRSEEHTSELQSRFDLVCRLLLEKKKRSQI